MEPPNPQLQFGERIFRQLVETVEDYAICALDPQGRIVYWNAGAAYILGYIPQEVLGRSIDLVFTDEDLHAGISQQELRAAVAQGRVENERWHVRKDGARFWALGVLVALRGPDQELIGFGKILRDRTDIKEEQEALRNRASELARADQEKMVFLATLSHELRTPLGVLSNCVELLHKGAAVERATLAGMIERQVRHTTRLVDDLSDIVRLGRSKLQLIRQPLDLREVIRQACEMVRSPAAERAVSLSVELPDVPVMIAGDQDRLLQVVLNLLNNAIKFSEPGGQIGVMLLPQDNEGVLRVCDDGAGIPPDQLASIFELFSQAHATHPGTELGLGIGLALTRDLVALHGGTIQSRSEGLGRGSEFIVRLPLLSDEPARAS